MNAARLLAALSCLLIASGCNDGVVSMERIRITTTVRVQDSAGKILAVASGDPWDAPATVPTWTWAPTTTDGGFAPVDVCLPTVPPAVALLDVSLTQPDGSQGPSNIRQYTLDEAGISVYPSMSDASARIFSVAANGAISVEPPHEGLSVSLHGRDIEVRYFAVDGRSLVVERHHVDDGPGEVQLLDGSQDLFKCQNLKLGSLLGQW